MVYLECEPYCRQEKFIQLRYEKMTLAVLECCLISKGCINLLILGNENIYFLPVEKIMPTCTFEICR